MQNAAPSTRHYGLGKLTPTPGGIRTSSVSCRMTSLSNGRSKNAMQMMSLSANTLSKVLCRVPALELRHNSQQLKYIRYKLQLCDALNTVLTFCVVQSVFPLWTTNKQTNKQTNEQQTNKQTNPVCVCVCVNLKRFFNSSIFEPSAEYPATFL